MRKEAKSFVLLLIIAAFGIIDSNSQVISRNKGSNNGIFLYGGLNWKYISGDRVVFPPPNQVDPVHPDTDSILFYDCLSPHLGAHYSLEILKSLNLRVGVELNVRKYHYRLYTDPIKRAQYPASNDYRIRTSFYNIEIPAELAYNIKKFSFGVGVKIIVYELQVEKKYYSDEVSSKYYDHHLLFWIHQPKILHPNIFIDYLAFQNPKFPIWGKASFEYGGEYGSTVLFSLKTKL